MPEMMLREAVARGLREYLDSEEKAFIMGEDVGAYGGAYAVTRGFLEDYGPERIKDTPISESVIVGSGIGAAMAGLRPVVELMTINFSLMAMDQIVNHAAKLRYMSNGQIKVPLIIRTVTGGGGQLGATHSQSFENWYASVPGLKVVVPATPYDALGLFRTATKDDNPIIFAEHSLLYGVKGEVPDELYDIPFGRASLKRMGDDVTIVAYSRMTHIALEAAEKLEAKSGKQAEVIDLRTLRPLDMETILRSVRKTNRVIVVEETWRTGGFAAEIASAVQEEAFDDLDGPVIRVGGVEVPAPYAKNLEDATIPTADKVLRAIEVAFGI
ncbi:MAG: alpha-ketoacid dehydrogenase subunit beta [Chloroflexi bacterium]|nr:alpha-ketoacid dehydrogenase subunit beta [Chloroflexota bacterium]